MNPEAFQLALGAASVNYRRCLVVIDSLNLLSGDPYAAVSWIPNLIPPRVHLLLSIQEGSPHLPQLWRKRPHLLSGGAIEVVTSHLDRRDSWRGAPMGGAPNPNHNPNPNPDGRCPPSLDSRSAPSSRRHSQENVCLHLKVNSTISFNSPTLMSKVVSYPPHTGCSHHMAYSWPQKLGTKRIGGR